MTNTKAGLSSGSRAVEPQDSTLQELAVVLERANHWFSHGEDPKAEFPLSDAANDLLDYLYNNELVEWEEPHPVGCSWRQP